MFIIDILNNSFKPVKYTLQIYSLWRDVKRMSSKADPCQKFACELQVCLQKNKYQEAKCKEAIKRLVKCCSIWKEESFKVCQGIEYEGKVNSVNSSNYRQ